MYSKVRKFASTSNYYFILGLPTVTIFYLIFGSFSISFLFFTAKWLKMNQKWDQKWLKNDNRERP